MSDGERPVFRQLLASGSDPSDRTISLALGIGGDRYTQFDISLGLVGPLMAALSAEAMKLNEKLPETERMNAATLNAQAVWLSQDAEGFPTMVFEMTNGSLLPLSIRSGDIGGLAAELALLAGKPAGSAN